MATGSNILAWEIPQTGETGGLQSMGLQRVGHNLAIPSPAQLLAFAPGKEQAAGVWEP